MKAENTVIQTTEDNCHNTTEERLLEQAETSFKAGVNAVVEFAKDHPRETQYWSWQDWHEWRAQLKGWDME